MEVKIYIRPVVEFKGKGKMMTTSVKYTCILFFVQIGYTLCCLQGICAPGQRGGVCACDVSNSESRLCKLRPNLCHASSCLHFPCVNKGTNETCSCHCLNRSVGRKLSREKIATDCVDVLKRGVGSESGVYSVALWKSKQVLDVYCDMDTDGGGWTVFQNRFDGSVDFYRNFSEYTHGFGSLTGEFWLGLRYIQEMARQGKPELRIDVTSADGDHVFEQFEDFKLSREPDYKLKLGKQTVAPLKNNYHGMRYNKGCKFSTYDRDVDPAMVRHCAELYRGGWWYADCAQANLNGEYLFPPGSTSMYDAGFGGFIYYAFKGTDTLKASQMMFRRRI